MKKSSLYPFDSSITESRLLPQLLRSTTLVNSLGKKRETGQEKKVGQELIQTLHLSTLSRSNNNYFPCPARKVCRHGPPLGLQRGSPTAGDAISLACQGAGAQQSKGLDHKGQERMGYRETESERDEESMWEVERAQGGEAGTGDRRGGGWEAAAFLVEVAGPGARLAKRGITIANGHGGNSTGHESPDHMLIGGLVFEKALRTDTHPGTVFSLFTGKNPQGPTSFRQHFSYFSTPPPRQYRVAGPHTSTQDCTGQYTNVKCHERDNKKCVVDSLHDCLSHVNKMLMPD